MFTRETVWVLAGWTMLHYFWVGTLIAVAAWLTRHALRLPGMRLLGDHANVRYLLAVGWFALLVASPAAIAVRLGMSPPIPADRPLPLILAEEPRAVVASATPHSGQPAGGRLEPSIGSIDSSPRAVEPQPIEPADPALDPGPLSAKLGALASSTVAGDVNPDSSTGGMIPGPATAPLPALSDAPGESVPSSGQFPAGDVETYSSLDLVRAASPADAGQVRSFFTWKWSRTLSWLLARLSRLLPWVWLIGSPLTFAWLATGMIGVQRMRRQSEWLAEDSPIVGACRRLAMATGSNRRVLVGIAERLSGPVLVGVIWPMILLPSAALTLWTPQQVEMVLLHELAHIRRWDNLVNLCQRSMEALFFFHPAVWLVSGWVRREREHCCDESVIARTREPRAYVEFLASLAMRPTSLNWKLAMNTHPESIASAMARRDVIARIRYLLKREDEEMHVSRAWFGMILTLIAATVLGIGWHRPGFGHAEESDAVPTGAVAEVSEAAAPAGTEAQGQAGGAADTAPSLDDQASRLFVIEELDAASPTDVPKVLEQFVLTGIAYAIGKDGKVDWEIWLTSQDPKSGELKCRNHGKIQINVAGREYGVARIDADSAQIVTPSGVRTMRLGDSLAEIERVVVARLAAIVRFESDVAARLELSPSNVSLTLHVGDRIRYQGRDYEIQRLVDDQMACAPTDGGDLVVVRVAGALPYRARPDVKSEAAPARAKTDARSEKMRSAADRSTAVSTKSNPGTAAPALGSPAGDEMATGSMEPATKTASDARERELLLYDGKPFEEWNSRWKSELKAERRIEALEALGAFGANGYALEATETVISVMRQYQQTGEAFPDNTNNPDTRTVAAAITTIQRIGSASQPLLLKALRDPSLNARRFAARVFACGHWDGRAAVPDFAAVAAATEDRQIEFHLALVLTRHADDKLAMKELLRLARVGSERTRAAALQGLVVKAPRTAAVAVVLGQLLQDQDATVRQTAFSLLGSHAAAGMGPGGSSMMGGMGMEGGPGMGGMGMSGMGGLGGPSMMGGGGGMAGMSSGPALREPVHQALAEISQEPREAIAQWIDLLNHEDAEVASIAGSLLVRSGEEAAKALRERLKKPDGKNTDGAGARKAMTGILRALDGAKAPSPRAQPRK